MLLEITKSGLSSSDIIVDIILEDGTAKGTYTKFKPSYSSCVQIHMIYVKKNPTNTSQRHLKTWRHVCRFSPKPKALHFDGSATVRRLVKRRNSRIVVPFAVKMRRIWQKSWCVRQKAPQFRIPSLPAQTIRREGVDGRGGEGQRERADKKHVHDV